MVFGNALYGGWSKPEQSLGRAKLALQDSAHTDRIFNSVVMYKEVNQNGSSVNLNSVINNCLTAINQLKSQNPSENIFGQKRARYQSQNRASALLSENFPASLMVRRKELSQQYEPNKFITAENVLLKIIEDLNILYERPEK